MNIEAHKRGIKESLQVIGESIDRGVLNRQRTLGFHCSAVLIDILELHLHSNNLISPGTLIKHDYFTSEKRALEKLPQEFDKKVQIIKLFVEIENKRNLLCYGKGQDKEFIEKYIKIFNKAKEILDSIGADYE